MTFRVLIFSAFLFSVSGCASYFLRKDCEATNWFQHGQDVAMKGQSLENDKFLSQCRKAEADINEGQLDLGFKKGRSNYCLPDVAYQTGKKGEPFSEDMCDTNVRVLKARHNAGLKEYCQESNGFNAGSSGKIYQNVCPQELEARFLPEFKKGRRQYLNGVIAAKEREVNDLDRQIQGLRHDQSMKSAQLSRMGGGKVVKRSATLVAGKYQEETRVEDDPKDKQARDSLQSDINSLDWQIRSKRDEQGKVQGEIRDLMKEVSTL